MAGELLHYIEQSLMWSSAAKPLAYSISILLEFGFQKVFLFLNKKWNGSHKSLENR